MARTDSTDVLGPHADGGAGSNAPVVEDPTARLLAPADPDDGRLPPRGARGAVVFMHVEGMAYEAEFIAPFRDIAAVPATDSSAADGA